MYKRQVLRRDFAGVPVKEAAAGVGLGDVFGAAFLYRLVSTSDLAGSAEFANLTAAQAASRPPDGRSV